MKRGRDVTPLDFAVNLRGLCVLVRGNSGKFGNFVLAELCDGQYFPTSGDLLAKDSQGCKKVLYSVKAVNFPYAVNWLNESYGDRLGMIHREIEFHKDEAFTKWVYNGGSIGIYPYCENLPKRETIVYSHNAGDLWDIDAFRASIDGIGEKRAFDTGSKPSDDLNISQIARIGVYSVRKKSGERFNGMFDNGRKIGIDALGERYTLLGLKSFSFIGALVKMSEVLKPRI